MDFELPDPHGFVSTPPRVPVDVIIKLSEQQLSHFAKRPGFRERRLADMVDVPFEL